MGREACKAEIMAYKKTEWPITSVECSRNVGKGKLSKEFEMCKKSMTDFFPGVNNFKVSKVSLSDQEPLTPEAN